MSTNKDDTYPRMDGQPSFHPPTESPSSIEGKEKAHYLKFKSASHQKGGDFFQIWMEDEDSSKRYVTEFNGRFGRLLFDQELIRKAAKVRKMLEQLMEQYSNDWTGHMVKEVQKAIDQAKTWTETESPSPAPLVKEEEKKWLVAVPKPKFSEVCHDYWMGEDGNVFAYSTDEGDRMPESPVEFYQLSNEPIGPMELFYASDRKSIHRNKWNTPASLKIEFPFYYRIVASTDKELNLPPIDSELIAEYIDNQKSPPTEDNTEVPADVMEWVKANAGKNIDRIWNAYDPSKANSVYGKAIEYWSEGAIAMYHKMKTELTELEQEYDKLESVNYKQASKIKSLTTENAGLRKAIDSLQNANVDLSLKEVNPVENYMDNPGTIPQWKERYRLLTNGLNTIQNDRDRLLKENGSLREALEALQQKYDREIDRRNEIARELNKRIGELEGERDEYRQVLESPTTFGIKDVLAKYPKP